MWCGGEKVNLPSPAIHLTVPQTSHDFAQIDSSRQSSDGNFPNEIWKSHNESHSIRTNFDMR